MTYPSYDIKAILEPDGKLVLRRKPILDTHYANVELGGNHPARRIIRFQPSGDVAAAVHVQKQR